MKKIFIDTKFRTIEVPVMRNGKTYKEDEECYRILYY